MTEGAPKPTLAQESLKKRIEDGVDRMILEAQEEINTDDPESVKNYLVRRFEERARRIFTEYQNEFSDLLEKLKALPFSESEKVATAFSEKIAEFLISKYSPEELESKLRREAAIHENWIELNPALSYEVSGDEIRLHVPMMFTKKAPEMFVLFKEGLRTIALRLQNESALSNIEKIVGYSWIVFEHPALVESMGFAISERDDDNEEALASIARDDFIKRYGN